MHLPMARRANGSKLKCSICHGYFKEPKLLPCLHSFCMSPCLERLVVQDTQGQSLTCPICKQCITLPDDGLAELLVDPQLKQQVRIKEAIDSDHCGNCKKQSTDSKPVKFCKQCKKAMCIDCVTRHEEWSDFSSHQMLNVDEVDKILHSIMPVAMCEEHTDTKAEIYCQTCSKLICSDASQHSEHSHKMISSVYTECNEKISSVLTPLKNMKNRVEEALILCETKENNIKDRKEQLKYAFESEADKITQMLETRRTTIVGSLECTTEEELKEIATYKHDVGTVHVQVSSCLEYAESCLEAGMESKMVQMKGPVFRQAQKIREEFDDTDNKILRLQNTKEMTDIEILSTDLLEPCKKFGEIVRGPISPQNCFIAIGNEIIVAEAEAQNSVKVNLQNRQNKPSDLKVDVTFTLTHVKTSARINEFTLPDCTDSALVNYRSAIRGKHSLDIKVNGESIQKCPFPIAMVPSENNLRSPKLIQNLSMPYSTASNSKGELIVAEQSKHCVSTLCGLTGERKQCMAQFDFPHSVKVDVEDNIYVVDKGNHQIIKVSSEGKLIASVGKGVNNLHFHSPTGITLGRAQQHLYVCDQMNHRIQVIDKDLKFVKNFGTEGDGPGQFKLPKCACVDEAINLYVTDFGNNRVQVFTFEGKFIRSFSEKGEGEMLQQPFAIAVDSSNIVYVSEQERNCISLFTTEGRYIKSFGSSGNKKGEFNKIRDIHIDQNDSIFVCDTKNNRVQIF